MNKTSLLLVLLIACAHHEPLVITGEVLIQLGDRFVATSELMDNAVEAKAITPEQYNTWKKFGERFQKVYPLAVSMWETARAIGDPVLASQMEDTVNKLAIELLTFKIL